MESDPTFSGSSLSKSDLYDDRKYKIKRRNLKKIVKARNKTHRNHRQLTLICSMKSIIKSRDAIKRRSIEKKPRAYQIMRIINGSVDDDSV